MTRVLLRRSGVVIDGLPLWISPRVYFDISGPGSIRLGDRCVISHDVVLLTHDFSLDRAAERLMHGYDPHKEYVKRAGIGIGANVFIGIRATILPGVQIGDGAIVAANSTVVRDVEPDTVVAGNPAKAIGSTSESLDKNLGQFSLQNRRR
ncbi:acyltransferase [Rhodococcus jostii]|uniref:Acyltransferase n=1 Tax=Rhodococcus jostii TaxID=132919 RepID=A0ABU4CA96_RHOJO|nr:acyltransferase [Rhodococcus jostii]MDV6280292.1 acyltransferase [Rhodococcus jostii]